MKRILLSFFFLLCIGMAGAQTPSIERLKQQLASSANEGIRLSLLLQLCEKHSSLNNDSLYRYATEATRLAASQKNVLLKSRAGVAMAYALLKTGNTDSALSIIDAALLQNPLKEADKRNIYFELLAQKADCYGDASDYPKALQLLYDVVSEAEQYKDSLVLAKNMNTIAVINYNIDDVPDAFNWYFRGIGYTSADPKFDAARGALYINLADAYRWVEKLDSAEYYINMAIPLCEHAENLFYLSNALRVKSSIKKKQHLLDEAEATMLRSIDISEKITGPRQFSNEKLALAQLYRTTGNVPKAIEMLRAALAADSVSHIKDAAGSIDRLRIEYYTALARCYMEVKDDKNYTATLEKIIGEKDKFYETNSARAIAELKTKYEVQKKESTIIKQQLDLTQKNYLFYGTLIVLAFAVILGFLLFKNYRRKQQLKTEQLLYEEKVSSLNAIKEAEERERTRIAADLHDNLGAYAASIVSNLDQIGLQFRDTQHMAPFQELRNNSSAIVTQLGDTIWALKKDELSLTAISDRVKIFMQRLQPSFPDISMEVREDIGEDHVLPALQAFHLMRIIQEAINNALKHSRCKNIIVEIEGDDSWKVMIKDDGIGFDAENINSKGYGLHNMKSRTQEFEWNIQWDNNGQGTSVIISPTTN
ncbi:MAG: ATP-binding protein [Ferruginibacter sp.]